MKNLILVTVLIVANCAMAQSGTENPGQKGDIDPDNIDIVYCEYQGSGAYGTVERTGASLRLYVEGFEKRENVRLKEIYAYPLTSRTFAYFFTLKELSDSQKAKFIAGRLVGSDQREIQNGLTRFAYPPKKLSLYVNAIKNRENDNIVLWEDLVGKNYKVN